MRLVACPDCHRQYDVTHVARETLVCSCGAQIHNAVHDPVHAVVRRCGSCGAGTAAEATSCDFCRADLTQITGDLSLICPECYARNADASRFCTACGVAFDPQPLPEGGEECPCPACGGLMPVRAIGGVSVNECPACHGLWVPGENFEVLVARAVDAAGKTERVTPVLAPRMAGGNPVARKVEYRNCPVCDAFMQRRNYRKRSGVIVDECRAHGTWLDADELEEIAGFILEHGGLPPEPRPEPAPAVRDFTWNQGAVPPERGLARTALEVLAALLS